MAYEAYEPPPVPRECSDELRRFLDEELARIALILNELKQYNEDNP